MAFPAFLDTCVLFGATLTDTLLRVAAEGAFSPYWSQDVLEELHGGLVSKAGVSHDRAGRRIDHMCTAFPDAMVEGYAALISSMRCDPKDRHVLAAAVAGHVEVTVTFNIKDFPASSTQGHGIAVVTPDDFMLDQLDLHPGMTARALQSQLSAASRPRLTMTQLLASLTRAGVPMFAREVLRRDVGE